MLSCPIFVQLEQQQLLQPSEALALGLEVRPYCV